MSNKRRVAIIGAGGFGREVFHLLDYELYECVGFLDQIHDYKKLPKPIIGHENDIEKIIFDMNISQFVVALGEIQKRKKNSKKN